MSESLVVLPTPMPRAAEPVESPILDVRGLTVTAGKRTILRNANLRVAAHQVYGLIGPSGAGKTTVLKCLNRMIELTPGLRVSGDILFHGRSIWDGTIHADDLRAKVGMLFQQPVMFPKSIYQNVIFGVRHLGQISRRNWPGVAERALREASLWEEVKDRLGEPAGRLSIGQQQRLCLARALASEPEVILMDEPTSALDPRSTQAIEDMIVRLKQRHTIILVTHNVPQARRVADWLACICVNDGSGTVVEDNACGTMLDNPKCEATIEYLRRGGA
jgi:phosphate transport system ATP-binding protein